MYRRRRPYTRLTDSRACDRFLQSLRAERTRSCLNCHHFINIDGQGYCRLSRKEKETRFI